MIARIVGSVWCSGCRDWLPAWQGGMGEARDGGLIWWWIGVNAGVVIGEFGMGIAIV